MRRLVSQKAVVELDLKSEAGRTAALEMIAIADVLIENFSPGVMERLGLSPTVVRKMNPRCVYLSLPGFASTDPALGDLKVGV